LLSYLTLAGDRYWYAASSTYVGLLFICTVRSISLIFYCELFTVCEGLFSSKSALPDRLDRLRLGLRRVFLQSILNPTELKRTFARIRQH